MQKVHDATGRVVAIILDNKTIKIIGNKCETTVCLAGSSPVIKTAYK